MLAKPIQTPSTNGTPQEGQFSLIHIPLHLYSYLLQPILRVLLPNPRPSTEPEDLTLDSAHGFLNISITPIECSIVCHTSWARHLFRPAIEKLPREVRDQCQISRETYIVFAVQTTGMEAGQRVMDLTAPLALAGIPIFFITTYYQDFILVPSRDRSTVGSALLERGFEFSECDSAYVVPTAISHSRIPSTASDAPPPSTPPPSNVAELQAKTFSQLKKRSVIPFVEPGLHLVQCSGKEVLPEDYSNDVYPYSNGGGMNGHSSSNSTPSHLSTLDPVFYLGLISALSLTPKFLSLTLATDDTPSLLIDKSLLYLFGNSLIGDKEGDLVPIFLDLSTLPLESTGIVCGVAGKLVEEMRLGGFDAGGCGGGAAGNDGGGGAELSYLSTARAGAVVLSSEGSARALEALLPLLEKAG